MSKEVEELAVFKTYDSNPQNTDMLMRLEDGTQTNVSTAVKDKSNADEKHCERLCEALLSLARCKLYYKGSPGQATKAAVSDCTIYAHSSAISSVTSSVSAAAIKAVVKLSIASSSAASSSSAGTD